jgi:hypothetical protein
MFVVFLGILISFLGIQVTQNSTQTPATQKEADQGKASNLDTQQ